MPLLPMRRVSRGESIFRRGRNSWINELTGEGRVYSAPDEAARFPAEEREVTDAVLDRAVSRDRAGQLMTPEGATREGVSHVVLAFWDGRRVLAGRSAEPDYLGRWVLPKVLVQTPLDAAVRGSRAVQRAGREARAEGP